MKNHTQIHTSLKNFARRPPNFKSALAALKQLNLKSFALQTEAKVVAIRRSKKPHFESLCVYLLLCCSLCAASPLASQERNLFDTAGNPQVVSDDGVVLIEGITVVPARDNLDKVKRELGIQVLVNRNMYIKLTDRLEPFLNAPLNETVLGQIKQAIVAAFREKGVYAAVLIPVQRVENGVVVFQVLEGKVKNIEYKGQKWFNERVIRRSLDIQEGDSVDENEFINRVTWANRNPFRKTQMILAPGKETGDTNLVFVTKDRLPIRPYVGSDNTGFKSNDVYRLYFGFNWALLTNSVFSYQYTASPNFHQFQSHTANYTCFLPWEHILTVFGTYGLVYPIIPDFTVEGVSVQGSTRYQIPIRPLFGDLRQYTELGFDYKLLKSNAFFVGDVEQALASSQIITVTQFLLSYDLQRNWTQHLMSFKMNMFFSPWKSWLFPHQTAQDYNDLRPGSRVRYAYWRASLSDAYTTSEKFTLKWQIRGQLATATLPTSEQFGLGGANTVRGYFDQQFVADNAFVMNVEFFSPTLSLFKGVKNELSFLAFLDYGYGYNYSVIDPVFTDQNLIGIGPGIRYDIVPYFSGKLDYGFQVLGIEGDHRWGRFHFSLNASY